MPQKEMLKVEWIDSWGITSCWEFLDELETIEPVMITTVGFLFSEKYMTSIGIEKVKFSLKKTS